MGRMFLRKFATVVLLLVWSLVSLTGLASEPDLSASQFSSFIGDILQKNKKKQETEYDYGVCIDLLQRYDFTVLYEKFREFGRTGTEEQFKKYIEEICIPENYLPPKTYLQFSYGVNNRASRTDVNSRDNFRVAHVYLDRTLPVSGAFFEGVTSVQEQESEVSTTHNREMRGAAFGRIAFAPEWKLDTVQVNQEYRPSHKGNGIRLVFGLNAGKSDISAYGFDVEAGYRKTGSTYPFAFDAFSTYPIVVDVFGRARLWLYDDSEHAVYSAAVNAKFPPRPFLGFQFDLGIGYQDNTAVDTKRVRFGGGFEFHRLNPLVIRLGANRSKVNDNEQNEYDTQISLNLIYSFPALRYTSPESDTQEDRLRAWWLRRILSIAISGSGGQLNTIDELRRRPG